MGNATHFWYRVWYMDLNKIPRSVVDQISLNYSEKLFTLGFRSGEAVTGFALLPEAAKALSAMLAEKVHAYEHQYGGIDISQTERGVESPIQITS